MSDVVTITARDGSAVEFVNADARRGAIKDVYFSPDKSYVVAFFRKQPSEKAKIRIEKLVGEYRENIFGRLGGDYWREVFCWPEKIVEYDDGKEVKFGVVVPFYRSNFYFKTGNLAGQEK